MKNQTERFLIPWVVAGVIPLVLLPIAAKAVTTWTGAVPLGPVLFLLFVVLFAGGQALALRTLVPWSVRWFAFSGLGCVLAMAMTLPILGILDPLGLPEVAVLAASHGVGGVVIGTAQWLILRRHVQGAWVWIAVNCLLWSILIAGWYPLFDATWAPDRMPVAFEGDHELRQLLRVTATTALATGPILLWLLARGRSNSGRLGEALAF